MDGFRWEFVFLCVSDLLPPPLCLQAQANCRVGIAALNTLAGYIDWVALSHVTADNCKLLEMLCLLLNEPELQIGAAECLLIAVSRKVSSSSSAPLAPLCFPRILLYKSSDWAVIYLHFYLRNKIQIWPLTWMILSVNVMPAQYIQQLLEPSPTSVLTSPRSFEFGGPHWLFPPLSTTVKWQIVSPAVSPGSSEKWQHDLNRWFHHYVHKQLSVKPECLAAGFN